MINQSFVDLIDLYFLLIVQHRAALTAEEPRVTEWKQRHQRWTEEMRRLMTHNELSEDAFPLNSYFSISYKV